MVTSKNSVPIIVERAMYFDANNQLFGAGHASAALANPSTSWFFAEGATGPFFNMYLLIANPERGCGGDRSALSADERSGRDEDLHRSSRTAASRSASTRKVRSSHRLRCRRR